MSSGFGAAGLVGTGFEFAFDSVSMKLYTTAFSVKEHANGNLFSLFHMGSLLRSRFLGCHATLPPKEDIAKNGCKRD